MSDSEMNNSGMKDSRERETDLARLETWLLDALERRMPPAGAEFLAGDLEEEFRRRRALGRGRAWWWLARQILGFALNGLLSWRALSLRSSAQGQPGQSVPGIDEGAPGMRSVADALRRDVVLGVRRLLRTPATSSVVMVTLAVGIGLNITVFMLADTLLLRPLPYDEPAKLLSLETNMGGADWFGSSEPELLDLEALDEIGGVAGWTGRFLTLGEGADGRRVLAAQATASLLELLGVPPLLGRFPDPEEDEQGADPVAVISYALWQSHMGGASDVIGRSLRLDGRPTRIVGVMPAGFRFPTTAFEAWVPLQIDRKDPWERNNHYLNVVARAEASLEELRSAVDVLATRSAVAHPDFYGDGGYRVRTRPLRTASTDGERLPMAFLLAAVGLLLLLACANVANVQLGRGAARAREVGVARALGASRTRLVSELMVESCLLSTAGAVLALALAKAGETALPHLLPEQVLRYGAPQLDGRVLAFALATAVLTTLVFGLWPAFRSSRPGSSPSADVPQVELSRHGQRSRTVRSALVVAQVALATVLLVGCGLLVRSLQQLIDVDDGLETDGVLALTLLPPADLYSERGEIADYYAQVEERLAGAPGVLAAGALARLPFGEGGNTWSLRIEGEPARSVSESPSALVQQATPGAFEALGLRTVAGRVFDRGDRAGSLPVVVVNEAFATEHWPGEDPVGKRMKAFMEDQPWLTVVGVVATVRDADLRQAGRPQWYVPHAQAFETAYASPRVMSLVVKTDAADPVQVLPAVEARLREVDPRVIQLDPAPLAVSRTGSLGLTQLLAQWLALFSGVAIALAAVGLYGVFSFLVSVRTREFGLRMALGATRRRVLSTILGEGLMLCLLGLAIGLGMALLASRAVQGVFYGVSLADPPVIATTLVVLAIAGVLALLGPAVQASRTGVAKALRSGG